MKAAATIAILVVAGGAVYLYRRGRQTHQAVGTSGDAVATVRAGASSVLAALRAATPSKANTAPADHTVATAGQPTGLRQTVPTHTRRATDLTQPKTVITMTDLLAQGLTL